MSGIRSAKPLEGKLAVATGAGSGMGRATAIRFAADKSRLINGAIIPADAGWTAA